MGYNFKGKEGNSPVGTFGERRSGVRIGKLNNYTIISKKLK